MKLDRLLTELGWADNAELRNVLEVEWDSSQECLPRGTLPFLSPEFVDDSCRALSLPAGATEGLLAVAEKTSSDPRLRTLAWHFHYCAFRCASYPSWGPIGRWPSPDAMDGPLSSGGRAFYLLILISGLPGMHAIYEARRIPDNIFLDTLGQLRDELAHLHKTHSVWGLSGPDRVQWYRFPLRGELFRLGRLVFQFGHFRWRVRVFRHRVSRVVAALSEGGVSYLPDGQVSGPGRLDTTGEWTSEFGATRDGFKGHPILPAGRALRRVVHLSAAEWQQVLARNDPALYIHLPGGSPLAHELCGKSFQQAREFFQRHFPDRPYVCFCCDSWVLNSQLQDFLPPTSNMVRFQREMHLLPHETHDDGLAHVILGGVPEDLSKALRDTALQRALVDHIASGGRLHAGAGAGFVLPEDLEWGRQVYVSQKLPWLDEESGQGHAEHRGAQP